MSARPGVVGGASVATGAGQSPNNYRPYITAEVRVFWPPLATDQQIEEAIQAALTHARVQIKEKRG